MSDLTELNLAEAREGLRAKDFSSREITDAYLTAIDASNASLNAYIKVTHDQARAMADASDAKLAKGEGGVLEGIPLGIKDLFATKGVHTQACSHILDGFEPTYDSTVTSNLWRLVRRLGHGHRGPSVRGGNGNRHGRLHPPAGCAHRPCGHQAHLWPLFALGHCGLRLLALSGRPAHPHRARQCHYAGLNGEPR